MKALSWVTDVVFPPRPDEYVIREAVARGETLPLYPRLVNDVLVLSDYRIPAVRAAITEHKFHHSPMAKSLLVNLLKEWLDMESEKVCIIPMPLSRKRQRERGYNQVEQIASAAITHRPNNLVLLNALIKARHTVPQTTLQADERVSNVAGVFKVKDSTALLTTHSHTLILLDDVLTTGATMRAAKTALIPHLPQSTKLQCIALAH